MFKHSIRKKWPTTEKGFIYLVTHKGLCYKAPSVTRNGTISKHDRQKLKTVRPLYDRVTLKLMSKDERLIQLVYSTNI